MTRAGTVSIRCHVHESLPRAVEGAGIHWVAAEVAGDMDSRQKRDGMEGSEGYQATS